MNVVTANYVSSTMVTTASVTPPPAMMTYHSERARDHFMRITINRTFALWYSHPHFDGSPILENKQIVTRIYIATQIARTAAK